MTLDFLSTACRGPEELTDPIGPDMSCTLTRCNGRFFSFCPRCFCLRRKKKRPANNSKAIRTITGTAIAAARAPLESPWWEGAADGVGTGDAVLVVAAGPPGKVGGPLVEVAGSRVLVAFEKALTDGKGVVCAWSELVFVIESGLVDIAPGPPSGEPVCIEGSDNVDV